MEKESRAASMQHLEALYQKYVRPLEREHLGEYVAVANDGRYVLGATLTEIMEKSERELPPPSFLCRVGDIALDRLR